MAKTEIRYYDVYLIWKADGKTPALAVACKLECLAAKDKAHARERALASVAGRWTIVKTVEL